jgi:serine protease Do
MKKYLLLSALLAGGLLLGCQAFSQDTAANGNEEIIIRKKGELPRQMTIRINGDNITINGKKPEDMKGNIQVIRRKSTEQRDSQGGYVFRRPMPYNPGMMPFAGNPVSSNKALLGVLTLPGDSVAGAKVEEVEKGTPADSAGLKAGDVITRVDDSPVASAEDLSEAIGNYDPGDQVTITYLRDGRTGTLQVKLGRNDNGGNHFALNTPLNRFHFRGPFGRPGTDQDFLNQLRKYHPFMGQQMESGPQLGMKVENRDDGKGITVKQVKPGSAAEKAGFKSGDILTEFAGQKITDISDILDALHAHGSDKSVQATVLRGGRDKTLTVQIPEAHQQADL